MSKEKENLVHLINWTFLSSEHLYLLKSAKNWMLSPNLTTANKVPSEPNYAYCLHVFSLWCLQVHLKTTTSNYYTLACLWFGQSSEQD